MEPKISSLMKDDLNGSALEQLSAQICANANKLSWYLESSNHPPPTFAIDTPVNVLPSTAPEAACVLRHKLKQDALKLFQLASGPNEYMAHLALNHQYMACVRYLSHFKVFNIVPSTGSISLSNLSVVSSAPLPQLTSVIYMAMTSGLFTSPSPSRVGHSATSLLLATSPEFGAWAVCASGHIFDASAYLAQANERWRRSEEMSHSAFSTAFATELSFPEYLAQSPTMGRNMGNFMKATQKVEANDLKHLVNSFDWQALGEATVVDVGSTSVFPSIALAKSFPLLSFELQMQPRATTEIEAALDTLPPDLASSIATNTHSMFAPQPSKAVSRTTVFLLRHVLHNLPDPAVRSVLANFVSVLEPSSRIIIMDLVLPQPGELDPYQEGMLRMRDLIQRELANGKARNEMEWKECIELGGLGLRIMSVTRPAGSDLSVLEVGMEKVLG